MHPIPSIRAAFAVISVAGLSACGQAAGQSSSAESSQPIAVAGADTSAVTSGAAAACGGDHRDPVAFIKKFDKDGNGTLELAELPEHERERMSAADTNHDGRLDADELKGHFESKRSGHFARMDQNQDGALTSDEVGERRWSFLSHADSDGDGKVSRAEMDQAMADGKLRHDRHRLGFRNEQDTLQ